MHHTAYTFEEHGEVLAHWRAMGWSGETVVVFDQHLDFKRIAPGQVDRVLACANGTQLAALNRDLPFRDDGRYPYGLDNFLYAAAALGLVSRVVWVHPEPTPLSLEDLGRRLWTMLSLVPGHGDEVLRSFHLTDASAGAHLAGLHLEVTTLRRLPGLDLGPNPRLDWDLDFFYDGGERPVHGVDEALSVLRSMGMPFAPTTMTYSIASGFMPESFRYLGPALAEGMGLRLERVTGSTTRGEARQTLQLLSSGQPLERERVHALFSSELQALGGPGWSLRALLSVRCGDIADAESSHARALEGGDHATWPAYTLGLHHLERRDYARAAAWLERAQGGLVDTLQAHALCLQSLAECQRGNSELALELATRSMEQLPLREEPYRIAALCAGRLERSHLADEARQGLARLEQRRRSMGL